jgi:hypothetical protein
MAKCIHCGRAAGGLAPCGYRVCVECCYSCIGITEQCSYIDQAEKVISGKRRLAGAGAESGGNLNGAAAGRNQAF